MGWLRESMSQAGLRSFGDLARRALAHPAWPADSKAQPRSLETILGRLDRREDLDWLADRPGIQQILAELIGLSVAEIRSILVESHGGRTNVTRLRLDDVRAARGFDFTQEPLPPTIPERVGLPATWGRCCWLADAGAGFSLVGQWLSARGLAQCEILEAEADIERLPLSGPPLYLELATELLDAFMQQWRGLQPLCIAVAVDSDPTAAQRLPPQFEQLKSAAVVPKLEQIVDWVFYRLAAHPQSLRPTLLTWLREGPLSWGLLQTLGDAIGLIGACVDGYVEPNQSPTKEALLRQWMAARTNDLAHERHRDLAALRQTLPEVLIDLAQAVLIDDARPFSASRTIDEWLTLVPEQHRRGPDIDWLTTRLVAETLPLRKPDLERAVQRLPPGAHRIVVALRELALLRPTSATRFAVRPHFVGRLVDAIARERALAAAPLFWGEALLHPIARANLLTTLIARASVQPESLAEDVLEHVELENPALVCAFETSFVLVGLSVLTGSELSNSVASALLEEQGALLLPQVGPIPMTRMLPAEPAGLCDLPGAFFLAAWALSEHSRIRGATLHSALDPWHASALPETWSLQLDAVVQCIQVALSEAPPWLSGSIRLLDRLRQSVGATVGSDHRTHELFGVGAVVDAIELGVVDWPDVEAILLEPWQWELFLATVNVRSTPENQLMQAVFNAWSDAPAPRTGMTFFEHCPDSWLNAAPAPLLARLMLTTEGERLRLHERKTLPASVWQAWLEVRQEDALEDEPTQPWE